MHPLRLIPIPYPPDQLHAWKRGSYKWFRDSEASDLIKTILLAKVRRWRRSRLERGKRPDRRFFGEAFVAATQKHRHGWYGSQKWMTNRDWLVDVHSKDTARERQLREALHRHFTQRTLAIVQERAARLAHEFGVTPTAARPVAQSGPHAPPD
jgi:hypothetical protein